ncbi:MAG: EscU/YscU/HrcU family type III secretion system export apparatus switch protein, partial [Spirochaetota bacterium]
LVQIAVEHDVPVVESSELAESLVAVDPGFLPEPFYQAVAEILSFVWRTGRTGGDRKKVWDEEHQGQ